MQPSVAAEGARVFNGAFPWVPQVPRVPLPLAGIAHAAQPGFHLEEDTWAPPPIFRALPPGIKREQS